MSSLPSRMASTYNNLVWRRVTVVYHKVGHVEHWMNLVRARVDPDEPDS